MQYLGDYNPVMLSEVAGVPVSATNGNFNGAGNLFTSSNTTQLAYFGIENTTRGQYTLSGINDSALLLAIGQVPTADIIPRLTSSGNIITGKLLYLGVYKIPGMLESVQYFIEDAGVTITSEILSIPTSQVDTVSITTNNGSIIIKDKNDAIIVEYQSPDTTTPFNIVAMSQGIGLAPTIEIGFNMLANVEVPNEPPALAADLGGIVRATRDGNIGMRTFSAGDFLMFYSGITQTIVIPSGTKIADTITAETLPGGIIDTAVLASISTVLTPLQQFLVNPIIAGVTSTNNPEDFYGGIQYVIPATNFSDYTLNIPGPNTILKTVNGGPFEIIEIPEFTLVNYLNDQYIYKTDGYSTINLVDQTLPINYSLNKQNLHGIHLIPGTNNIELPILDNPFAIITLGLANNFIIVPTILPNKDPVKSYGKILIVPNVSCGVTIRNFQLQDLAILELLPEQIVVVNWVYLLGEFYIESIHKQQNAIHPESQTLSNVALATPELNLAISTIFAKLTGDVTTLTINKTFNGLDDMLYITSDYNISALSLNASPSAGILGPYNLTVGEVLQFKALKDLGWVRVG